MRIMVDECLYAQIVEHLRRDGHDVHWVCDDLASTDDQTVLDAANVERRILLSEDRDFGELIFRDKKPAFGVVSIRVSEFELQPDVMGAYVATRIRELAGQLPGHFTVIEPGRERSHPLPNVLP